MNGKKFRSVYYYLCHYEVLPLTVSPEIKLDVKIALKVVAYPLTLFNSSMQSDT